MFVNRGQRRAVISIAPSRQIEQIFQQDLPHRDIGACTLLKWNHGNLKCAIVALGRKIQYAFIVCLNRWGKNSGENVSASSPNILTYV